MEEIKFYLDSAKEGMENAISRTISAFSKVRAGKANPAMLDGISVIYYGNQTPLNQVASINTPDARTIIVKPWEKTVISDIETALINSDLGLNPQSDGETIKLFLPPLTEERRKSLVKTIKGEAENGKISIRNVRKDANDDLKKLKSDGVSEDDIKRAEDQVQKLTDTYTAKIDEIFSAKEEEIMTI